ncbi:TolC family protein [Roseateles toxinivorans]|uniref:Outer membrane protein TolC n=1 Tax=Roseateles toxinivorans TaxID=270368 RepID=A0A4R6QKC7_9BURK|nr:TolC family protein [Roseateles toxinivorans]TDP63092.1 outer membrane protein TolC [Roseateles toxinivorans]
MPSHSTSVPARHATARALRALLLLGAGASLAGASLALGYAEALSLAERQNPALLAQQSSLDGALAAQGAAGALPDPRLSVGIENLPISGMDRWSLTRDFMTMRRVALMQEVPNRAKRDARSLGAQARAERERAVLIMQRLRLHQALSTAWLSVQSAERREAVLLELTAENQRLQQSMGARIAGGSVQAGELLTARQEALALSDRRDELKRDAAKARAALRRLVGAQADETLDGEPPLAQLSAEALRARLHQHAELAVFPAMQGMAQAELREAQAEARGDWSWELAYSRRGSQWGDMVSLQLSFDLPWQKDRRQQPLIASRQREAERVAAEREDAERRHRQELDDELAELQSLDSQIARLETAGLPLAQDRAGLALSGYQSGRGDLGAVLSARTQVLEARLRLIELDLQRSLLRARLNYLAAE